MNEDDYINALRTKKIKLARIPDALKTYKICLEAVKVKGGDLNSVPNRHRTIEVYLEAIRNNPRVLKIITAKLRSYRICVEAIKYDNNVIQLIPREHVFRYSHFNKIYHPYPYIQCPKFFPIVWDYKYGCYRASIFNRPFYIGIPIIVNIRYIIVFIKN